jgi:hypothetical protein
MATITPNLAEIEINQTQLFAQSGIGTPVWTLEGIGTLNQSGLFTAPSIGGESTIRVHSAAWSYVDTGYWDQNADDTLVKNTSSLFYYGDKLRTNGALNAIGDWVEIIANANPYFLGIRDVGNYYLTITLTSVAERAGGSVTTTSFPSILNGDKIRFTLMATGQIEVRKNGIVVYTSTNTAFLNRGLNLTDSAPYAEDTIVQVPKFGGSGITGYTEASANVVILFPILTQRLGIEIYCQSDTLGLSNNANVTSFTDLSGKSRHLTAKTSDYPLFKTAGNYIQFNGTDSSLLGTSNIPITVFCGFIVAKYDDATFPNSADGYKGLLTDLASYDILVGNANTNKWFDFGYDLYEFRSDDRIYPDSDAPAPMQNWRLIFFRFWRSITLGGVQIGQQRNLTARKWKGGIKFLALFSVNMTEMDIRKNAESIAAYYSINLADVYPYQTDRNGLTETTVQRVNFYDPPEGDRISEVLTDSKRTFDMKFSSRRSQERAAMKSFHASHYAGAVPCIYRNYNIIPPEDIEGYFDSQYTLDGSLNNYDYGFKFKER